MEKKINSNNNAHIYGVVNEIYRENEIGDKKNYGIKVMTTEVFGKDNKETKNTFHDVQITTDNKALIEKMDWLKSELAAEEPKRHSISLDGKLITRQNEKDGVTYNNSVIVADAASVAVGEAKGEQVRNTITLKGNISDVKMKDNFAVVSIATHYFVPTKNGELVKNFKGEEKPYTEEVSFHETRVSGNRKDTAETFEQLKSGELAKGAFVEVRGQMHNVSFTDSKGVNRYGITIDVNNVKRLVKKEAVSEEAKTEVKKEVKPAEKPAEKPALKKRTSKKTSVKM